MRDGANQSTFNQQPTKCGLLWQEGEYGFSALRSRAQRQPIFNIQRTSASVLPLEVESRLPVEWRRGQPVVRSAFFMSNLRRKHLFPLAGELREFRRHQTR